MFRPMSGARELVDFGGLIMASLAAPVFSVLIYGLGWLAMSATHGGHFDPTIVPGIFVLVLLVTGWGFALAFIFGGAAMAALAAWLPTWADRWQARVLTGLCAAGVYCAFGLVLAEVWTTGAFFFAPWAVILTLGIHEESPERLSALARVVVCILVSGAASGWVYHRFARRG